MTHPHQMVDPAAVREFVFAGNARLTLVSKKTGARFTYRVSAPKEPGKVARFVGVLTGPQNDADYCYLGHYYADDRDDGAFRHGVKSKISADAPSAIAWTWFDAHLRSGRIPEALEVWHSGKCGRCNRTLTTPESIARGLGPECAGKL